MSYRRFTAECCEVCQKAVICKIYELLDSVPALNFSMAACRFYEENTGNDTKPGKTQDIEEKRDIIQDIDSLAERIRAASIIKMDEPEIIHLETERECPFCHQETKEFIPCSECGTPTCGDCITETFSGETLCPACYEKKSPDELTDG